MSVSFSEGEEHGCELRCGRSVLSTVDACERAKAALDPRAKGVTERANDKEPTGCSRYNGEWYFNPSKGQLDGVSEPVCKLTAG